MRGESERILVIRLSSLGDIARLLPSLGALASRGRCVHLTVEDRFLPLVQLFPLAEEVIPYPRRAPGSPLRHPLRWSRDMRDYVGRLREGRYDLALDLHGILRSALVAHLSGARATAGFAQGHGKEGSHLFYGRTLRPADRTRISRYERYAGALRALGFPSSPGGYLSPSTPAAAASRVSAFLEAGGLKAGAYLFAFVGTSAAQAHKRWPFERFLELARLARERLGMPTVLGWGPEERALVAGAAGLEAVFPIPDWPLPELLETIRRAGAFVGADTGAMHLAALMGVPTVALLGPTDPVLNEPFGARKRVLFSPSASGPCRGEACTHDACLGAMPASAVADALEGLLARVSGEAGRGR